MLRIRFPSGVLHSRPLTNRLLISSMRLRPHRALVTTYFLILVFSYTRQLQQSISNRGSEFETLGSCAWQKSHLLLCRTNPGEHFWQWAILYLPMGKPSQRVVNKKSWICYCQVRICTPEWESGAVWWDRWFGRVGSTLQECCLLTTSSERSYGSYMSLILSMNCSLWTVAPVMTWTYRTVRSYLTGKPKFHNVSSRARFHMSLSPPKTLDWSTTTSTTASGLSLHWLLLWIRGRETNPPCWSVISTICSCLQTKPWNWKRSSQNITVNNSSTILDVLLKSLTAFFYRSPSEILSVPAVF